VFERFTQEARQVVVGAREQARELRAERIEPVHLLLALTGDPGRGGAALRSCGVDSAAARSAVGRAGGPLDADALAAFGIDLEQVRAAAEARWGRARLAGSRRL
jgi:ATP-dependent Clp protease ATP-binding subunit ClpA